MLTLAALGIAASAVTSSVVLAIAAFCVAAIGFVAVQPLFWTLPTGYLGGAAAAGGIALINSIGNLGGFVAPNLKAFAERLVGSPQAGMLSLAVVGLIGAALLQWFKSTSPETVRLPQESTASLGKRPSH
jgi:nitrate/nitrite transporter NarK